MLVKSAAEAGERLELGELREQTSGHQLLDDDLGLPDGHEKFTLGPAVGTEWAERPIDARPLG